jgi:hypothetical protein
MNESRLYDAFDDCLTRLSAGESIDACLSRYPELAAELRPLLEVALVAARDSAVPRGAQMRSRAALLSAAGAARRAPRPSGLRAVPFARLISTALAVFVALLIGGAGLVYISQRALPGDPLYGVKLAFEDARLGLASSPAARLALEDEFNRRRIVEIQALLASGRTAEVYFEETLVERGGPTWLVGPLAVEITPDTVVGSDCEPGYLVAVTARAAGGRLSALQIDAVESEHSGLLEREGGSWAIGGVAFLLVPETEIHGVLAEGAPATARLRRLDSGERIAVVITIQAGPAPTGEATVERTGEPSATPERTSTPGPTRTPRPSATPTRTPEWRPSNTPRPPTPTAAATATEAATEPPTVEPTVEPDETETPEPDETETPEPDETDTPEPDESDTPEPTRTEEPSRTPEPTRTPDD